ncbi:YidB family protein [Streptomyces sp. NBC_01571]|uniref:YidB family protein n=1 Tax=Streptomyces sp. NBC_01571 TaxID=2975883 RepID=UPI0022596C30|nr:YidB family protein [Streptomyces sp. NBC_01571]MCX4574033.1 YidB family protein [Streptomyces sp. NBC_01571]
MIQVTLAESEAGGVPPPAALSERRRPTADNDLGSLPGSPLGGGQGGASGGGDILGSLPRSLTNGQGGGGNPLGGLMDMLTKSGPADRAQSWIGTGENKPVSAEQVAQALPADTLQEVAARTGVSSEEAADQIARYLPRAVDKLTPGGELPRSGASLEDPVKQRSL